MSVYVTIVGSILLETFALYKYLHIRAELDTTEETQQQQQQQQQQRIHIGKLSTIAIICSYIM